MHAHAPSARDGAEGSPRAGLQLADVFRRHGEVYLQNHRLAPEQIRALEAMMRCRTAALGGHLDRCLACGYERPSYNSCRDRHCPTCQGEQQARWIDRRLARLVPTHHFHVVFTLPSELRALALANRAILYDLLFAAASQTLLELADDRWKATPGITAVLHTWTRQLDLHPHLHCVVTGGGLSKDGARWISCKKDFLFPVRVLGALFRGKFLDGLRAANERGELRFTGGCADLADPVAFRRLLSRLTKTAWVVFAKRPFGGPVQVIRYLGRYTHRVALSSSRLVAVTDRRVVFKTHGARTCALAPHELIRRFLLHVLPKGFRKIRHYGLFAPANVAGRLATAQRLAGEQDGPSELSGPCPLLTPDPGAPRLCPVCRAAELHRDVLPPRARPPPEVT